MASTQTRASSDDLAARTRRLLEVVMTIPILRFGTLNLLPWSIKTSEISGKKITPFGFFSFSLLKRKFTSKVSRINFLDEIFTLGISVVEKKESVVDLCIFFFLNTKQTRNLDEEFFQKARQFGEQPLQQLREDLLQAADQVRRAAWGDLPETHGNLLLWKSIHEFSDEQILAVSRLRAVLWARVHEPELLQSRRAIHLMVRASSAFKKHFRLIKSEPKKDPYRRYSRDQPRREQGSFDLVRFTLFLLPSHTHVDHLQAVRHHQILEL
jgi:hypothetical protein